MFALMLKQVRKALKSWSFLPPWIRQPIPLGQQILMLRSTLGMTQTQLARFMKSTQRVVVRNEKEEGDPQISTLKRIAENLNCELLIRFVPKTDLKKFMKEKAQSKAEQLIKMSTSSANIELQKPSHEMIESEIRLLTREILDKRRSSLWES